MSKELDLRLKLSRETHSVLRKIAEIEHLTLQHYVERLLVEHCERKLAEAKALVDSLAGLSAAPLKRERSIYFIRKGTDGPIKIGVATSARVRLSTLQTGSSEKLKLLLSAPTSEELNEQTLHSKFRHLRLEGEWFKPEQDLLDFIRSNGGQQ
jgi:hypothetical protein